MFYKDNTGYVKQINSLIFKVGEGWNDGFSLTISQDICFYLTAKSRQTGAFNEKNCNCRDGFFCA